MSVPLHALLVDRSSWKDSACPRQEPSFLHLFRGSPEWFEFACHVESCERARLACCEAVVNCRRLKDSGPLYLCRVVGEEGQPSSVAEDINPFSHDSRSSERRRSLTPRSTGPPLSSPLPNPQMHAPYCTKCGDGNFLADFRLGSCGNDSDSPGSREVPSTCILSTKAS